MSHISWSYSRWTDFKTCPLRFKLKHLDRVPEPPNQYAARGIDLHKSAEDFLKAGNKPMPLPGELLPLRSKLMQLRARPQGSSEHKWAFTDSWKPTTWKAGWVRMVLDYKYRLTKSLTVIDFKSGKVREQEHAEQMSLYAAGAVATEVGIERVDVELWYIDHNKITRLKHTADEARALQKEWDERVQPMLTAKAFPPRANPKCQWCAYSKAKGGPCKF